MRRLRILFLLLVAVVILAEAKSSNRWGDHHSSYETKHVKSSHFPDHKDSRHHSYHANKEIKKHEKAVAKHAPLDIPHREARIQSDLKTSWKKLHNHKDHWEREDLHLQDLSYESRHHGQQKTHRPKVHHPIFVDNVKHSGSLHHKDELIEDHFYPHNPKKVSERKHESGTKTHHVAPKSAHRLVKSLEHKPHLQSSKRTKDHKPRKQKKAYEKKQQQQHKKRYGKLHKSW